MMGDLGNSDSSSTENTTSGASRITDILADSHNISESKNDTEDNRIKAFKSEEEEGEEEENARGVKGTGKSVKTSKNIKNNNNPDTKSSTVKDGTDDRKPVDKTTAEKEGLTSEKTDDKTKKNFVSDGSSDENPVQFRKETVTSDNKDDSSEQKENAKKKLETPSIKKVKQEEPKDVESEKDEAENINEKVNLKDQGVHAVINDDDKTNDLDSKVTSGDNQISKQISKDKEESERGSNYDKPKEAEKKSELREKSAISASELSDNDSESKKDTQQDNKKTKLDKKVIDKPSDDLLTDISKENKEPDQPHEKGNEKQLTGLNRSNIIMDDVKESNRSSKPKPRYNSASTLIDNAYSVHVEREQDIIEDETLASESRIIELSELIQDFDDP